jgi:D-alanine-D-alanine ligase-like ATP-grasp enzyme
VYTHDATEVVSKSLIEEARAASSALRSAFCGVDVITTDATRSLRDAAGVIGEVNTTPGLHHHYMLSGTANGDKVVDAVLAAVFDHRELRRASD